jgi:hypothetical protein
MPATNKFTRRALEAEPFDLKKHAMEGIEEALYWHTVGVISELGASTGTAIAIRFRGQCLLVTANHVIKDTADDHLGFFFRPAGTLQRMDWWQDHSPDGRLAAAVGIKVFHRFSDTELDLAFLVVSPILESAVNVKFFDLADTAKLLRPLPSVAAIGFPSDTRQALGQGAVAISAVPLWGNIAKRKDWRPHDFRPRRHLLLHYLPATFGRHPGGFSGAGIWYHEKTPKPAV